MQGLLDFLSTPAGQGLLTGAASYAANAGRGAPVNSIGRGLLGGLAGYQGATDRQVEQAQLAKRNELFDLQLGQTRDGIARENQIRQAAQRATTPAMPAMGGLNGSLPPELQTPVMPGRAGGFNTQQFLGDVMGIDPLKGMEWQAKFKPESQFAKVDPKDYTAASVQKFAQTGNHADLQPVRKLDVVNNQAVDLYQAQPGQVFDQIDPNKPFHLVGGKPVANTAFQEFDLNKASRSAPKVEVNTGQKGLDNELKIRSDFRSEPIYKAHQDVQAAYQQITTSLRQASPAGDLAGATKIMKILDPGSVVRESELGMAMAATGALDRLTNYADMVIKGTKLTPSQRKDFQDLADRLYGESVKQYNAKRGEYDGFAKDYGLNADRILGPAVTSPKLPAQPRAPMALPSNPTAQSLTKGQVYSTPLGDAIWDGMKFVKER